MPRSRVLSFMSQWGAQPRSPTPDTTPSPTGNKPPLTEGGGGGGGVLRKTGGADAQTPSAPQHKGELLAQNSPSSPANTPSKSRARGDSRATRPGSMIQAYQPPQVDVADDTPPELQPIFTLLNSHSNKLYQEGYFLKLHDLDSRGRPSSERVWVECFAQLVGTVLSLWDAAALDAAGEDGEVVPTFVNLSDASIKMIESLPMNGAQGGSLQNVLSVSTAANNRYLLHFNSLNSLTQWTAGIRLAMFEHTALQEAYTGSLIAGKGKSVNNIKVIMERARFPHEDWARVRFGAGTPWTRCWCVITPPDEKDYARAQKVLKKSAYDRKVLLPKGNIKFYDTRRITKKTMPVATITDAYAAYAIYPQSKPLIDQSTLVKLEGVVTVHGSPDTTTEGFVFIMPEAHPAVSGFEMMLQFLFPVFDAFALYGRPSRLIADTLDSRGLMFAMPRERRYGYLDILDVSGLIHTTGSHAWSERKWREEMKKLTSARMLNRSQGGSPLNSRQVSLRRNTTTSRTPLVSAKGGVRFDEGGGIQSSPNSRSASPVPFAEPGRMGPIRTDSAPPVQNPSAHKRAVSEAQGIQKYVAETPPRLSYEAGRPGDDMPPPPPKHGGPLGASLAEPPAVASLERIQSGTEMEPVSPVVPASAAASPSLIPPEPVANPPAFTHSPNSRPATRPYQAAELRRAHSNVDEDTLHQMQDAVREREVTPEEEGRRSADVPPSPLQNSVASSSLANRDPRADRSQGAVLTSSADKKPRDFRPRLSAIPGSPVVGQDAEYFQSPEQAYAPPPPPPLAEGVAAAAAGPEQTLAQLPSGHQGGPPVPLHASHSIARKPLPKHPDDAVDVPISAPSTAAAGRGAPHDEEEPASPDSPSGLESWAGALIDEETLKRVLDKDQSRNNTMQSHASSATPDYASTAPSEHEKKVSIEKPRAGQLRTVGDPDYHVSDARSGGAGRLDTWEKDKAQASTDMPTIDFGPTFSYKPTGRPDTSGTITGGEEGRPRPRSADRLRESSGDRLSRLSLGPEANRRSYFGGMPATHGAAPAPSGSPGDRHSIAWQPSSSSPVTTPGGGKRLSLTPEQWVQYRAEQAARPMQPAPRKPVPAFAHQRTASANSLQQQRRSLSKTPPPLSRTPSGDWTQYAPPQERTPPSRPHSRGSGVMLYSQQPTNLTAKEQMHVARATGTPLINYTSNADRKQHEVQQPGLFGALAARERDREESKKAGAGRHSLNNPMVQQAIAARQQQQREAELQAQAQYQVQMQQQAYRQAQATQAAQAAHLQHMQSQQQMQPPPAVGYGPPQQAQTVPNQGSWQWQQQQQQPQYRNQPGPTMQSPAGGFPGAPSQMWDGQSTLYQQQGQLYPHQRGRSG